MVITGTGKVDGNHRYLYGGWELLILVMWMGITGTGKVDGHY